MLNSAEDLAERLRDVEHRLLSLESLIGSEVQGENSTMYRMARDAREKIRRIENDVYGAGSAPGMKNEVTQMKAYLFILGAALSIIAPCVITVMMQ